MTYPAQYQLQTSTGEIILTEPFEVQPEFHEYSAKLKAPPVTLDADTAIIITKITTIVMGRTFKVDPVNDIFLNSGDKLTLTSDFEIQSYHKDLRKVKEDFIIHMSTVINS